MVRKKKPVKALAEENSVPQPSATPTQDAVLDADKIEKEFFEIINFQRKSRNNLLGVFVEDRYEISNPELIEQLLDVPKKYEVQEDNVVRCSVKLSDFVLNFKIELEISESYCNAKLFIVEIEQEADESIKHITQLGEIVEPYSPEFVSNVLAQWHVYLNQSPYEKNDFLLTYLSMQKEEYLFNLELSTILAQLYVVRMMGVLDNMGTLGEKVQYEFKMMMEKAAEKDPSIFENHLMQKIFLDKILLKNKAFDQISKTPEGAKALQGFSTPLKNMRDKTYPSLTTENVAPVSEQTKPKAKESAPKAKSKSKGKSKSDGGKAFKIDYSKLYSKGAVKFGSPSNPRVIELRAPSAPPSVEVFVSRNRSQRSPEAAQQPGNAPRSPEEIGNAFSDLLKEVDKEQTEKTSVRNENANAYNDLKEKTQKQLKKEDNKEEYKGVLEGEVYTDDLDKRGVENLYTDDLGQGKPEKQKDLGKDKK